MQENYKDFDLGLRSMLSDAEEKAPSGIWEAVSSRLDAIDAAAAPVAAGRSRRVWAWSAAALAMAAALVGGIFLFKDKDVPTPAVPVSGSALIAEATPAPAVPEAVVPETVAPEPEVHASAVPTAPAAPETQAADVPAAPATPAATAAESPAALSADSPSAEPRIDSTPAAPAADPFALMAFEDGKAASRPRFSTTLGGGISSNKASVRSAVYGAGGQSVQHRITEKSSSTYGIPVSFGLGVRLHLNDRLSIGSGLDYSMLTRTFDAVYTDDNSISSASEIRHTMHYIGIPLDVFYTILNTNDISFYVNAGGEAEYGVANKYRVKALDITETEKVHGLQWSAGMGLGVEFNVGNVTSLFVEPRLKYYFNCDQPKNVRTEKPLQLLFRAGLRFDL